MTATKQTLEQIDRTAFIDAVKSNLRPKTVVENIVQAPDTKIFDKAYREFADVVKKQNEIAAQYAGILRELTTPISEAYDRVVETVEKHARDSDDHVRKLAEPISDAHDRLASTLSESNDRMASAVASSVNAAVAEAFAPMAKVLEQQLELNAKLAALLEQMIDDQASRLSKGPEARQKIGTIVITHDDGSTSTVTER